MESATILVVEDEPSIGEVVSLYLKRAGYAVSVPILIQVFMGWLKVYIALYGSIRL